MDISKTTYSARPADIKRDWIIMDATGVPVGRLAADAARVLRGKHKPTFTPHMDTGDHVIIINAARAIYTGNNKPDEPIYRHTLYPGGIRQVPRGELLEKRPTYAIMRTVKGMLPHNALGAKMLRKLRVYEGAEHRHEAQVKGSQRTSLPQLKTVKDRTKAPATVETTATATTATSTTNE